MKEKRPWRLWTMFLVLLAGSFQVPVAQCQSYNDGQAKGDIDGSPTEPLGFSGIVQRHDGYVKGETPTIPKTSFSCSAQQYNPGLYADMETQCQVYHVCFDDRQESFLCGPGTNFNQKILACDFWYNFDCQDSATFYGSKSTETYKPPVNQPRNPQPQTPSYPSYPQQEQRPVTDGDRYQPPRVSLPQPPRNQPQPQPPRIQPQPQPPRIQPQPQSPRPQPPRIQPQPPQIHPQPPSFQPQPPAFQPEPRPPAFQPQPRPPAFQPQPRPPAFQPQPQQPQQPHPPTFQQPNPPTFQPQQPHPPTFQPHRPTFEPQQPHPPTFQPQPQPPRVQPQPPRFQPQPQPPRIHPQPPVFKPDPPRVSITPAQPHYPQGSGQPPYIRPPPPRPQTPIQQEDDSDYRFENDYRPQQPISLPPPQQPHPLTPRPMFPPVISPPRVSRPPLTSPAVRHPAGSSIRPLAPAPRPTIPEYPYHPDANLKGQTEYRPPQQPSRVARPSTGYPTYPSPRPVSQRPVTRPYQPPPPPPPPIQQEHVDTEYVPPPPPPPPRQPSRPSTSYVPPPPPPPPPVQQQEVEEKGYARPPPPVKQPQRPSYVPPPVSQHPDDSDYRRPQPPVSPSIIREQQKPANPPSTGSHVSGSSRPPQPQPPQRPKPVFPPQSDHPNANIKGGPGYQQPPPPPRFEPTRISRPSTSQVGYQPPPHTPGPRPTTVGISVKPATVKQPTHSGSTGYKPPQPDRVKKPSEPPSSIYRPPISPVIDHPNYEIKGTGYQPPAISQQPQRVQSPSTHSGVKRPQSSGGSQQQTQRPRAPIVVSRPHPPSIKKPNQAPVDTQSYEKARPHPPAVTVSRVKQPSQTQTIISQTSPQPHQPRFPAHQPIDHPNANTKGGPGYQQSRHEQQPIRVTQINRPSGPPSLPSTSYEQKTSSPNQGQTSGRGYPSQKTVPPRGDDGHVHQEIIQQPPYNPQRRPQINTIPSTQKVPQGGAGVKDVYKRPQSSSHQVSRIKTQQPDYNAGSSYTSGPDTYPKPEFGHPQTPYQPISTPSRSSQTTKQGPSSQNSITQTQIKPAYQGSPATSGSGTQVRPDYPFREVPGHQPPNQRQVFPHRENPDHPNESLKGSGAYRPPPPAGFQAAASEVVQQQQVVPEPEPSSPLLGDIGAE